MSTASATLCVVSVARCRTARTEYLRPEGTTVGKLVRDLIPDIIRARGREPEIRVLDDAEYADSLFEKLFEEAQELREAHLDDLLEEAADVYEALRAITANAGIAMGDVVARAKLKREERGGFADRVWLAAW